MNSLLLHNPCWWESNDDLDGVTPLPQWPLSIDPALDDANVCLNLSLKKKEEHPLQKSNFGLKNTIPGASTIVLLAVLLTMPFHRCLGTCFRHNSSTTYKVPEHKYASAYYLCFKRNCALLVLGILVKCTSISIPFLPTHVSKNVCDSSVGLNFSKSWKPHVRKDGCLSTVLALWRVF